MTKADKPLKNLLVSCLSNQKNPTSLRNFLLDLLTPTELKMFEKRLAAAKMLAAGLSYREIKEKLPIQNNTISAVSYRLATSRSDELKRTVQNLKFEAPQNHRSTKIQGPKKIGVPAKKHLPFSFGEIQ